MPGDENGAPVWLPIDAKFPTEDYQRLIAAQEKGDVNAIEDAMKGLETQLRKSAKDICAKYINPPRTTDFALMFLPTEGLYAEAIRRVGLVEQVQRECRVVFAGSDDAGRVAQQFADGVPHARDPKIIERSLEPAGRRSNMNSASLAKPYRR